MFWRQPVLGEFEGRLRTVVGDVVQGLEVQYQSISKKLAEKGEAIRALEGKFSKFTVLEAPEAAMMGNGRIFCITCTANMAALRDGSQLNSKFLAITSIHLCLVPLTMHRCKSSTLPVLYPTGAVKDT